VVCTDEIQKQHKMVLLDKTLIETNKKQTKIIKDQQLEIENLKADKERMESYDYFLEQNARFASMEEYLSGFDDLEKGLTQRRDKLNPPSSSKRKHSSDNDDQSKNPSKKQRKN
jgi:hypothetical protein